VAKGKAREYLALTWQEASDGEVGWYSLFDKQDRDWVIWFDHYSQQWCLGLTGRPRAVFSSNSVKSCKRFAQRVENGLEYLPDGEDG